MASCGDNAQEYHGTQPQGLHVYFLITEHMSGKEHTRMPAQNNHKHHQAVQYSPWPARRPENSSSEDEKVMTLNPNESLKRKLLKKSLAADISL